MVIVETRREDLNGKAATVKRYDEGMGRYICILAGEGEKEVALKREKLQLSDAVNVEEVIDVDAEAKKQVGTAIPEQLRLQYMMSDTAKRKTLLAEWLTDAKITQEVYDNAFEKLSTA